MLKHLVAIIVVSLLVISGMPYVHTSVHYLVVAQEWIANLLKNVFSVGTPGDLIRQLLALLVIPVAIALLPTLIYWLVTRRWFTYFMETVWVVWLVQTTALVVVFATTTG